MATLPRRDRSSVDNEQRGRQQDHATREQDKVGGRSLSKSKASERIPLRLATRRLRTVRVHNRKDGPAMCAGDNRQDPRNNELTFQDDPVAVGHDQKVREGGPAVCAGGKVIAKTKRLLRGEKTRLQEWMNEQDLHTSATRRTSKPTPTGPTPSSALRPARTVGSM